ncbi:MAG: carbon monoxide dehydrogenase subunit G [Marmoricola sp.]
MRFTGERDLATPVEQVWEALHDREVLRRAIPGCEDLVPLGAGRFAATLAVRVGPVADVYRGTFTIDDLRDSEALVVRIEGRGRFGRLEVDLQVGLVESSAGGSSLRYDAHATVGGFVARVGSSTMSVVGGHLTGVFFRDLDRSLRQRVRSGRVPELV